MDTQETGTQANATEAAESVQGGETTQVESTQGGESGETASGEKGTKGTEGLFDGMDAPTLHKSYKSLQSQYTKINEGFKKLEKYGGPDQLIGWADYLSNNPEFAKWAQDQQNKNVLGMKEGEVDPDQQRALDAVRKIAESEIDKRVKELHDREIAPLSEAYKAQMLQGHFDSMDKKYGKDWHEMRDTMSELSESLPQSSQDRPTMDDIEDLFFKALRKTGKIEAYAKKTYEKTLTEKKLKSTERPSAAPAAGAKPAGSIREAFEMAKRAHNMT